MLVLTHASLARIDELFKYKDNGFELAPFPGYTNDQWGIKAHNRPWIEKVGHFSKDQKIIEVGGAYSLLPKYLAEKYDLEAWIGDDFGMANGQSLWSRWGDPYELETKYPGVKYVFENFGQRSPKYPDQYFDRIFSVSTLEHIPRENRLDVLWDMHRCLKPAGRQMHSIDVPVGSIRRILASSVIDRLPLLRKSLLGFRSQVRDWIDLIKASGVVVETAIPSQLELLDRGVLVESVDVVYRFYPPKNSPKAYNPSASLLLIIEDR